MSGPRPYTGTLAGMTFRDGVIVDGPTTGPDGQPLTFEAAEAKARSILGYARRHGLEVDADGRLTIPASVTPEPADPRFVGQVRLGRLRDAAVDPRPGDFLAPTNAGQANPHGPDVVSPEIHASEGVRPVKGGDAHVGAPAVQDAAETAHTEGVQADGVPGAEPPATASDGTTPTPGETLAPPPEAPPKNASQQAWADYAVALGLDRATAEVMSRGELIDNYAPKES